MGIVTFLAHNKQVLTYSSPSLVFVFLLAFSAASISMAFLISAFFDSASNAASAAGIIWFLSYFPYLIIQSNFDNVSGVGKHLYCVVSTTCMAIGANVIADQEGNGVGVTWVRGEVVLPSPALPACACARVGAGVLLLQSCCSGLAFRLCGAGMGAFVLNLSTPIPLTFTACLHLLQPIGQCTNNAYNYN